MSKTLTGSMTSHLAGEVTTLAICFRLTLKEQQPNITNITNVSGDDWQATTEYASDLEIGDHVKFVDIVGMTGINGEYAEVTNISGVTVDFTLAGVGGTYSSGGQLLRTMGLINIDKDFTYDNVTYRAAQGSVPSVTRINNNLIVNDVEMTSAFNVQFTVSEADIYAGKLNHAEAEAFMVNYNDDTMGKIVLISGYTGEINLDRDSYVGAVSSLSSLLAQDTVELVTPDCRHDLGDTQCGVNTSTYEVTGSVTTVNSKRDFNDTSRTEATGYFDGGLLTWTSGNNIGVSIEVQSFNATGDNITIFQNMLYDIEIGDAYKMIPGCDKTKATCISKYNNVLNFNGFDFLPGAAEISKIGGYS